MHTLHWKRQHENLTKYSVLLYGYIDIWLSVRHKWLQWIYITYMQNRCPLYLQCSCSAGRICCLSHLLKYWQRKPKQNCFFFCSRLDQGVSRLPILCYLSSLQEAESRKHPSEEKFKSQRWLWSERKIGADSGSLRLTDWFKVTKVVTLKNSILQCWQSKRVEAQQRAGCSIIYFSSCFCWAEYLEVSSVSKKMKQCWISKRYAEDSYFKVLPFLCNVSAQAMFVMENKSQCMQIMHECFKCQGQNTTGKLTPYLQTYLLIFFILQLLSPNIFCMHKQHKHANPTDFFFFFITLALSQME